MALEGCDVCGYAPCCCPGSRAAQMAHDLMRIGQLDVKATMLSVSNGELERALQRVLEAETLTEAQTIAKFALTFWGPQFQAMFPFPRSR